MGVSRLFAVFFLCNLGVKLYLEKPDFEQEADTSVCFQDEAVFELIQMDGCKFHYFKIRAADGAWTKTQVIECFDTGSRFMLVLEAYYSESFPTKDSKLAFASGENP
jgi:hypothetical protein